MTTERSKFFFSYAREDSELVLKLAKELRQAGASLWLDQLDLRGGHRWDEAIQAALESCQGMVVVLSPSAVTSQNVLDEVSYALEERKQVIPLLYRECAIPFRLRRVQHIDFTAGYEDGFADLLRALELEMPAEMAALPEEARREAREEIFNEPLRRRGKAALVGAVGGFIVGTLTMLLSGNSFDVAEWWIGALASSFFWAMAGAITGTDRRVILVTFIAALAAAVIGFYGVSDRPTAVLLIGVPWGAIFGAVAGVVLKSLKVWRR